MVADYRDQTDIFNPRQFTWQVHVIGAGGIGSALIYPLAKLGVNELHIWDHDVVEEHNLPAQLIYRESDLGLSKVEAAKAFLERQEVECTVVVHDEWVTADSALDGVVMSGVDSMDSRMVIWEAVKANSAFIPLYLDGRIGAEELQLFTVDPSDFQSVDDYEGWLFPGSEGADLPCAARTVIHPAGMLANLMVAQLTRYTRGLPPYWSVLGDAKHMSLTAHLSDHRKAVTP